MLTASRLVNIEAAKISQEGLGALKKNIVGDLKRWEREEEPPLLYKITIGVGKMWKEWDKSTIMPLNRCSLCLDTGFIQDDNKTTKVQLCQYCPAKAIFGGRYQVVRQLGTGNFSQVFLVRDTFIPDTVRVVKLLHDTVSMLGRSEIRWLKRLQLEDKHGRVGVVKFFGTLKHSEYLGLVLEYLQPVTKDIIESVHSLRRMIVDVALTLDTLHKPPLSAIHADIKLENLMYSDLDERFRLIDFGNCTPSAELEEYRKTFEIQSLLYRAPEVLVGNVFGPEIDIWSFGVVLVQILSKGQPPFLATDRYELLNQISEIIGPFPDDFQDGKFFKLGLPLKGNFEQPLSFWKRWRKSNLARMLSVKDSYLVDLLAGMLECDPKKRFDARAILVHPFLAPLVPSFLDHDFEFSQIIDGWNRKVF